MDIGRKLMEKPKFDPTPEQLIATNPKHSVWVSANAGSGKTHVLVERVIRLLLDGNDPSSILCITYTKAAASEMSVRLFNRMSSWAIIDDKSLSDELQRLGIANAKPDILNRARQLFARALETPGGLKIQTIHAFCEKLLQQFPVEASMAPGFKVLDDRQTEAQLNTAINATLKVAEAGSNIELGRAFATIIDHVSSENFESLMKTLLRGSSDVRAMMAKGFSDQSYQLVLKRAFNIELSDTLESAEAEILAIDPSVYNHHAAILSTYKIHGTFDTAQFLKKAAAQNRNRADFKNLFLTQKLEFRKSLLAIQTGLDHPATKEFLEKEKERIGLLLQKYDMLLRIALSASAFMLAADIYKKIEWQKNNSALYSFDDLIERTANLLSTVPSTQWVLFKLDAELKHILVDEAQDTSPAQWKIITALCEEFFAGQGADGKRNRTVFVVGDRKQSIYSFQGADAFGFAAAKTKLTEKIISSGESLSKIDLTISYRSTERVLQAVDAVFPVNQPALLGFAENDVAEREHQSNRKGLHGVFEIWPLIEDETDSEQIVPWTAPVDAEPSTSARRMLDWQALSQSAKSAGCSQRHFNSAANPRAAFFYDYCRVAQSRCKCCRCRPVEIIREFSGSRYHHAVAMVSPSKR
jgi:ATP-dependent helicase/nuclease subunit A